MKEMNYFQDRKIHVMSGKKTQIPSTSTAASETALTTEYTVAEERGNLCTWEGWSSPTLLMLSRKVKELRDAFILAYWQRILSSVILRLSQITKGEHLLKTRLIHSRIKRQMLEGSVDFLTKFLISLQPEWLALK